MISCSSSPFKQSVILLHKSSFPIHFSLDEQRNDDDALQAQFEFRKNANNSINGKYFNKP